MFRKARVRMLNPLTQFFAALIAFFALALPVHAVEEYKLGPGDSIRITVYEHPDMTTETQLTETGNISFPLLGEVNIGGLARSAAEAKLANLLQKGGFVNQPQINISIIEYRSQQVSVLGQVSKPGKYPISGPTNLIDVLSLAGGATETGADYVTVVKNQQGKTVKQDISLAEVFKDGDMKNNISLANGDVVFVPRAPVFYIYGEVQRAGAYRLEPNMTVMQGLSLGGGLSTRGTEKGVKVNRRDASGQLQTLQVSLSEPLQPDDVVYVRESLF